MFFFRDLDYVYLALFATWLVLSGLWTLATLYFACRFGLFVLNCALMNTPHMDSASAASDPLLHNTLHKVMTPADVTQLQAIVAHQGKVLVAYYKQLTMPPNYQYSPGPSPSQPSCSCPDCPA